MDSILTSIKKLLGIGEEYTVFDTDIIMHINSVINILYQLGIESAKDFYIDDASSEWSDFLGEDVDINLVKSYVYLKVRMLFDPPTGSIADSFKEHIKELEWRISIHD